ncbi:MAG: reverse transcriptase domain-containing protein, partial [Marinobacter sp.]
MWKNLRHAVAQAKDEWYAEKATQAIESRKTGLPREFWNAINATSGGTSGHHRSSTSMTMYHKRLGRNARNHKENLQVFGPHFQSIFNKERPDIDPEQALQHVPQRDIMTELDAEFTMQELEVELTKAQNYKAPGASGLQNEALKCLNRENKERLLGTLNREFRGETESPEYKVSILKCLYKMKGDITDPNKWRGICLKETTARILSGLIGARLIKLIKKHGIKTQFGHVGCIDGIHTLRTALQVRRYHNQETHALFVDLVKAFDSADHAMMFETLKRYGAPRRLTEAIRRIYNNVMVRLTIGDEVLEIPYTIGVQQGDNMAPLLFIFLMQAVAETLDKKWTTEGLRPLSYRAPKHHQKKNGEITHRGRLLGQPCKTIGRTFHLHGLYYCDDGAFLFETHDQLKKGANLIYHTFNEFGLEMHIGREGVDGG